MDRSFANGNGASVNNGPGDVNWARELMLRDPTSWTLTLGENPA